MTKNQSINQLKPQYIFENIESFFWGKAKMEEYWINPEDYNKPYIDIFNDTNLNESDIDLWSRIRIKWSKDEFIVVWVIPMPHWMELSTINWVHTYILLPSNDPYTEDILTNWNKIKIRSGDIDKVISKFPYEKIWKGIYKFEWIFIYNKDYLPSFPFNRDDFMKWSHPVLIQQDNIMIQSKKFPKKYFWIK